MIKEHINQTLHFSVSAEILAILATGTPKDALDIFQALKFAMTRKADELISKKAAELNASKPPAAPPIHVVGNLNLGFAFNYDAVVMELTMLVSAGKLRRMNGTSEPVYALA